MAEPARAILARASSHSAWLITVSWSASSACSTSKCCAIAGAARRGGGRAAGLAGSSAAKAANRAHGCWTPVMRRVVSLFLPTWPADFRRVQRKRMVPTAAQAVKSRQVLHSGYDNVM
jgi:hypothetical protein